MCTKPSLNLSRDRARMSAARSCLFAFSPQISRAWSDSGNRAQRCEFHTGSDFTGAEGDDLRVFAPSSRKTGE